MAIPALLPLASAAKSKGSQEVYETLMNDLALSIELLCRACYLLALSAEIVPLREEEGVDTLDGASDVNLLVYALG